MRIKAKTKFGETVYIISFIQNGASTEAVTVNAIGEISTYHISRITIIDNSYLTLKRS